MNVELVFVLDETGSMQVIQDDTIGGYNTFVEEQKALAAEVSFSLVLFSEFGREKTFRYQYENVPVGQVVPLSKETYRPRGVTPLLDAIGGAIDSTGKRLAAMPEGSRPDKVIVAILTDGHENASQEYTLADVQAKIEHQRSKYNWEFLFLGSGIDAIADAGSLGIDTRYAQTVSHDSVGTRAAYAYASNFVYTITEDDSA